MTTKRREWPNSAREVRDQAAEAMTRALKLSGDLLHPLVEMRQMTREEVALRAAKTLADVNAAKAEMQLALRLLESVGAATKP